MARLSLFLTILFLIFLFHCKEEETTESEQTVIAYGEAGLTSKLTDEQNNVLGDTTVAVNNIEVILYDENHEQVSITTTNEIGQFLFGNLETGTYSVKARIMLTLFESESNEKDSLKLWFPFLDYYVGFLSIPASVDLSNNDFEFETAYPNPGNNTVNIVYSHSQVMNLKIDIYNHQDELIKNFINVENQEGGNYPVVWDFTNNNQITVESGIYFIYAESDSLPLYFTSVIKK